MTILYQLKLLGDKTVSNIDVGDFKEALGTIKRFCDTYGEPEVVVISKFNTKESDVQLEN